MVKGSPDGVFPTAPEVMEKWMSIKSEISAKDRKKPLRLRGDRTSEDVGFIRSLLSPLTG